MERCLTNKLQHKTGHINTKQCKTWLFLPLSRSSHEGHVMRSASLSSTYEPFGTSLKQSEQKEAER